MDTPAGAPTNARPSEAGIREAYQGRAAEYIELFGAVDLMKQQDRAAIGAWAREIDGLVLDAGCGPGHWTDVLYHSGLDVTGLDMVPEFLDHARKAFPRIAFHCGSIESLPVASGSLGAILAWYSVIHAAPSNLPVILAEFARALRPGGSLLLGFFEGTAGEPFDHAVVTAYYWSVDAVREMLHDVGFDVAQVQRRTDPGRRPHAAITAIRRAIPA